MLKSMTGFGRSVVEENGCTVIVEIKTLNSKQTDIYCRLPKALSANEVELRNRLTMELERGKIELNIHMQRNVEKDPAVTLNKGLLKAYLEDITATSKESNMSISGDMAMNIAISMPNAYTTEALAVGINDDDWNLVQKAVKEALDLCNKFRIREGDQLTEKFKSYIENIKQGLSQIEMLDGLRIPAVRERLKKSLGDLLSDDSYDKNRFEQELIYYIEKYDISEEKQRLNTHLNYFMEILGTISNGKKLSFMAQELGREINTIGSKANDHAIQHIVVNMKDELEKIKEQTANVL